MLFRHVYILYHCFIKIKHNLTNFKKIRFGLFPQSEFFCLCVYSIIFLYFLHSFSSIYEQSPDIQEVQSGLEAPLSH